MLKYDENRHIDLLLVHVEIDIQYRVAYFFSTFTTSINTSKKHVILIET